MSVLTDIARASLPRFPFRGKELEGCKLYIPFWDGKYYGQNPATYISLDHDHTPFTRTGGTWGKYGWTADGNDKFAYTVANWRSTDQVGAVSVWLNSSYTTDYQVIFASGDTASANYYMQFGTVITSGVPTIGQSNNDAADIVNGSTNVCDGSNHFITYTTDGSDYFIYVDNGTESLSVVSGANSGDWFADTGLRDNVTIGVRTLTSDAYPVTGTIGEIWYHSKTFTLGNHKWLKRMTERRYAT